MPSSYSNLNFHDRWDLANWKEKCADQRKIAEEWPAYDPKMLGVEEYGWKIGPWSVRLTLDIWKKPYMWHASAAIVEHVAYETVTVNEGIYKGVSMEVPQDALLAVSSWVEEHHQQARFLLNEMLGPILRPDDKQQQALEHDGLWAKQVLVKYEGNAPWRKRQH